MRSKECASIYPSATSFPPSPGSGSISSSCASLKRSAADLTRLKASWEDDYKAWCQLDLSQ